MSGMFYMTMLIIVLAIENVSNFQMHNEPRLFQRIF